MQLQNNTEICDISLIRYMTESSLFSDSKKIYIVDSLGNMLHITLIKDVSAKMFEVNIMKKNSSIKHHFSKRDKVLTYVENDETVSLFFDSFDNAVTFISLISFNHKEYMI